MFLTCFYYTKVLQRLTPWPLSHILRDVHGVPVWGPGCYGFHCRLQLLPTDSFLDPPPAFLCLCLVVLKMGTR